MGRQSPGEDAHQLSRADLLGLLACGLGIAVLVPVALVSRGGSASASTAAIAETTFALAGVRRRPVAALVWDDLGVGNPIHESDTIFVPEAATATVRFHDGARPQSTVYLFNPAVELKTRIKVADRASDGEAPGAHCLQR